MSILFEERITERKSVSPLSTSCPLDELSLRLGCWRRETTRFRRGAHSGTKEVAERPSQAPNGSAARLRELFSRDERAWRKAKRAGAKSAQAPSPTGARVGHGGMAFGVGPSIGATVLGKAFSLTYRMKTTVGFVAKNHVWDFPTMVQDAYSKGGWPSVADVD